MLNDYEDTRVEETEDEIYITGENFDQVLAQNLMSSTKNIFIDRGG